MAYETHHSHAATVPMEIVADCFLVWAIARVIHAACAEITTH